MPSRDSTGRPLSGAACRRRARERAQGAPLSTAPTGGDLGATPPPPTGVDAVLVWAQRIQATAATLAADADHADRARLVGTVVGALGKLKGPASDSEAAVSALKHYRRQVIETSGRAPPGAPCAVAAWAFGQLAQLLHEVTTAEPLPDEGAVGARARSLAQVGLVFPARELARLVAELDKAEAG